MVWGAERGPRLATGARWRCEGLQPTREKCCGFHSDLKLLRAGISWGGAEYSSLASYNAQDYLIIHALLQKLGSAHVGYEVPSLSRISPGT